MSNTYGTLFKITTFGESHGPAVGVVIDGCPAGLEINKDEIQVACDQIRFNDQGTSFFNANQPFFQPCR